MIEDETPSVPATPYEIANLAAKFLPPIEWPEKWKSPTVSFEELMKDQSERQQLDAYLANDCTSTTWDLMCTIAVARAEALIKAAVPGTQSNTRRQLHERAAKTSLQVAARDWLGEEVEEWSNKFHKAASGRQCISRLEALRLMLPKAKDTTLISFYASYRSEPSDQFHADSHSRNYETEVSTNMVDLHGFLFFAKHFRERHEEREGAWRAQIKRHRCSVAGKKGAQKKKRRSAKKGA